MKLFCCFFAEPLYPQFATPPFAVDSCSNEDFLQKILRPTFQTPTDEEKELLTKNFKSLGQKASAYSMFFLKLHSIFISLNDFVENFTKGCEKCCPVHCIQAQIKKVRPGRFKLAKHDADFSKVLDKYCLM